MSGCGCRWIAHALGLLLLVAAGCDFATFVATNPCTVKRVLVLAPDTPQGRMYGEQIDASIRAICTPSTVVTVNYLGEDDAIAVQAIGTLASDPPQLIVTLVHFHAEAARSRYPAANLVMTLYDDPVALGFAQSLARPGLRTTGYTRYRPLIAKRIELLKEAFPGIRSVTLLTDPFHGNLQNIVDEIAAAERETATRIYITKAAGVQQLLDTIEQAPVDAFYVATTNDTYEHASKIVDAIARRRLPAIFEDANFAEIGGVISVQSDNSGMLARLLQQITMVVQGTDASSIPFETPKTATISVNLAAFEVLPGANPKILLKAQRIVDAGAVLKN